MQPQQKSKLAELTVIAKKIIFDAERFKQFLQLIDTRPGALQAVKTVMGAIEQKTEIPQDVAMLLAINIYVLLVEMAQDATGLKADKKIVQTVLGDIMKDTFQSYKNPQSRQPAAPAQQPPAQPAAPGLINQGA